MQRRVLDLSSYVTIAITLVLFLIALIVKGFAHDILLEAGVFLVSVKLIIMSYQTNLASEETHRELRLIRTLVEGTHGGTS